MIRPITTGLLTVFTLVAISLPVPAEAGCGCEKPPPPPSAIRPAFGSPGDTVTVFDSGLREGRSYGVWFGRKLAFGRAVRKRDLADGVERVQLPVRVPDGPIGPTEVKVMYWWHTVVTVPETDFTVLQAPLSLHETDGDTLVTCYTAAVGADGTMYIPVDVAAVSERMLFGGIAQTYPLRFGAGDIMIYNTQGYTMEMLSPEDTHLISIRDVAIDDSYEAAYDRHEFNSYRDAHLHVGDLALDPADDSWHVDGTAHIDHDNLVVAILGQLESGATPAPGETPPFDFSVVTTLVDSPGVAATTTIEWSTECSAGGSSESSGSSGSSWSSWSRSEGEEDDD